MFVGQTTFEKAYILKYFSLFRVRTIQVIDLLNSNQRTYLAVRWSRHKGFYVENLFHVECESIEDLFAVLEEGKLIWLI